MTEPEFQSVHLGLLCNEGSRSRKLLLNVGLEIANKVIYPRKGDLKKIKKGDNGEHLGVNCKLQHSGRVKRIAHLRLLDRLEASHCKPMNCICLLPAEEKYLLEQMLTCVHPRSGVDPAPHPDLRVP